MDLIQVQCGMNGKQFFVVTDNDHAPFRTRRFKSTYSPLLTDDIKELIYYCDYLKKKSVQGGSMHHHRAYKNLEIKLIKLFSKQKPIII